MNFPVIGSVVILSLLSGCATITRGSTQSWSVETDPVGADITLSSGEACKSPCTLKKKRKHPFSVDICKNGYERVVTTIDSSVKGAGAAGLAGNVLVGGVIGIGVDAATGASKDLLPNPLVVTLPAAQPGCDGPKMPPIPTGGVDAAGNKAKEAREEATEAK